MTGGLFRCVAASVLALVFAVSGAAPAAYAHTELENAVPAAGVRLAKSPGSIQLSFTEPVDADLARVAVVGPDGQNLAAGRVRQSGPGVIQPITAPARAGTVEVAYRVVSLDGHPVSGSYTFEVLRGDPDAARVPEGGAGAGGGAGGSSGGATGLLLAGGAVLLLVAAGAVIARWRSRSPQPAPQTTPPTP